MPVIALDLGGTKLASAIVSPRGQMLWRKEILLNGRRGKKVGGLVTEEITKVFTIAAAKKIRITGLGVSVPGIYSKKGTVWAPNIPGWRSYPLKREIQAAVEAQAKGKSKIPVLIASDRACYILGETWRGNAQECKDAIFVAVGTGIGAGIMVDGKVLEGAHDVAGAIGWMALTRPYRRDYKHCGCFEYYASGTGLVRHGGKLENAAGVFAAFGRGDPIAKAVVAEAIQFWGMAVANLISIFNPQKIIFGGGVFGPAKRFIPAIYTEAKKWAQPIAIKQVKLCASRLGPDAGLLGAAYLALRSTAARK